MFRVFFCVFYMVQLYSLQIPRLQILVCWKVASGMVAELRAEGAGGWSKILREVVKPDLGSQATVTWYKALNLYETVILDFQLKGIVDACSVDIRFPPFFFMLVGL